MCDYPYNVDCKGAATPKPTPPTPTPSPVTHRPTQPTPHPTYPSPSYPPNPYPSYPTNPSPGYSNPWLSSKFGSDPWQRSSSPQLDVDKQEEEEDQEPAFAEQQQQQQQEQEQESQSEVLKNPWSLIQNIPPSLMSVPCQNGDVHRLNEACTNVVVCRNGRPQLVQCSSGLGYDRPSDSCQPISVTKW